MPTLTTRKTVRAQVATLLDEIANLTVYDHETKDFQGITPVAMVYSDGTRTEYAFAAWEYHRLRILLLWERADDENTEDYLDDLAVSVRQKLIDNASESGYWNDIEIDDEFSEQGYPIIDGKQYRSEIIRATVKVLCDA